MVFRRKKARNEAREREEIAQLLLPEREQVEVAVRHQGNRNEMYRTQGIPAPHPEICNVCLPQGREHVYALAELIAYREGGVARVVDWLNDSGSERLIERLARISHTYRTDEREGEPSDAALLAPLQRVRAYALLEELETQPFVNDIGKLVEQNPKDGKTELGGFILPDTGLMRARIYDAPSASVNARSYAWKCTDILRIPHIALVHLHAVAEDCSLYAGPSWSEREGSDMVSSRVLAAHLGESHDVVITKLPRNCFNVDYYTTQRKLVNGRLAESVACVDLGNYRYG